MNTKLTSKIRKNNFNKRLNKLKQLFNSQTEEENHKEKKQLSPLVNTKR